MRKLEIQPLATAISSFLIDLRRRPYNTLALPLPFPFNNK